MRWLVAALALGVAACDESVGTRSDGAGPPEGYTIEIRANSGVQTFLVTAPDGRTVGARAAEGVSALLEPAQVQELAADPPPQNDEETPEVLGLRLPGFEMSIGASQENADGDHGRVNLSIGGEQNVTVNADEGGPGEADDRAYVRIAGADEEAVRNFIAEADELSPSVQAQMLGELGLD